jgi:hypothetical protein
MDENKKLNVLNEKKASILVVGAGFIGVEWATELQHFCPNMTLAILDALPQCLGPLPAKAAAYCTKYMEKKGIKTHYKTFYAGDTPLFGSLKPKTDRAEFYKKIGYGDGRPDKEFICMGVKASNYFMPEETLSKSGPAGQPGWILVNQQLGVVTRKGKRWGADQKGYARVYAIGDCNYGCIPEEGYFNYPLNEGDDGYDEAIKNGAKPEDLRKPQAQKMTIMPIPKISYPGEEEAVIACANLKICDKILFQNKKFDWFNDPYKLHDMHWPWGAGMFATSLGPDDACFVAGANWNKGSGFMVTWGSLSAVQKEIIEASKVDECANGVIGRCIWHFVHHTPVHLWGGGPLWGY